MIIALISIAWFAGFTYMSDRLDKDFGGGFDGGLAWYAGPVLFVGWPIYLLLRICNLIYLDMTGPK
jgi:hypothetical protein